MLGKFKDFFFNIGIIIVPLIVYGFICRNNVHLDIWDFSSGSPFVGLLRVFAGICMGANCFRMGTYLKKIRFKQIIIALIMLGSVLAYCMFYQKTYADYFLVLVMTLALAAILSAGEVKACSGNRVLLFLGKWSMFLYMSHWVIRYIIPKVFVQMNYYELLPIYIAASLLWSLVVMLICRILNCAIYQVTPFNADDVRGCFTKDYSKEIFEANGINHDLMEVFYTTSYKGVIRALHFQREKQQPKLVRCIYGHVYDVVVDLRPDSPTFKKWLGFDLIGNKHNEILVPGGCAHGYLVLEESIVSYKCAEKFYGELDDGIIWNDPDIGVEWGLDRIDGEGNLIIADKDKNLQSFKEFMMKYGGLK